MAIERVPLELIDDNPFQARQVYHRDDIEQLAESIRAHGMLETPVARQQNGRFQLVFGHLRKRAFMRLAKDDPEEWGKMPLDIQDIADQQMALFSLEENLKRRDITPIETARAVDKYLTSFPSITEDTLAKLLNMTQSNISHMRRVLQLPTEVLEKIDQGRINFHMARELLVFQNITVGTDSVWSSKENKYVTGPKDSRYLMLSVIRSLSTEGRQWGHPSTVEGIQKAIHDIAKTNLKALEKGGGYYSNEPLFDTRAAGCLECQHMITTHPTKSHVTHWCTSLECWERKQQEHKERAAAQARQKMAEDVLRTVAAAEDKRQADQNMTQVIIARAPAEEAPEEVVIEEDEEARARIEEVRHLPKEYPCHGCLNVKHCDRGQVIAQDDGTFICKNRLTRETIEETREKATVEIPPELRSLIEEKAGTRAQVLDLNELWADPWRHNLKQGYESLDNWLKGIINPEECLNTCTHGFHYAFDSRNDTARVLHICTDTKCIAQKKAAFTRAKNAEGQAKKRAEAKAIKEAIDQTTALDRPRIKLILLAQMEGSHAGRHYYGANIKYPEKWLWDRLSAGTPENQRNRYHLFRCVDKLSDEELARLVVEQMFYYLSYTGEIGDYEIKTDQPLEWMGIKLQKTEHELAKKTG